jgi:Ni/Co efflux regulator RcnB
MGMGSEKWRLLMRKSILMGLMAVTAFPVAALPSAASAQSTHEVRRDRQELREDRRELRQDRRSGESARELRHDRREVARDRREVRRDRRSAYVAPYRGWNYRAVNPGYRLQRGFYGSRYVISNYGHYRLRAPGYNQRWIRYGDDLLLVNVRNGRVLQVIRNRY